MVDSTSALQMLPLALAVLGFGWVALSMDSHWRQVYSQIPAHAPTQRSLRILGFGTIIIACVVCFSANRPTIAILVSIMLLAIAAPVVAAVLTWRPSLLRMIWRPHPGK